jgi:hypothetical protein
LKVGPANPASLLPRAGWTDHQVAVLAQPCRPDLPAPHLCAPGHARRPLHAHHDELAERVRSLPKPPRLARDPQAVERRALQRAITGAQQELAGLRALRGRLEHETGPLTDVLAERAGLRERARAAGMNGRAAGPRRPAPRSWRDAGADLSGWCRCGGGEGERWRALTAGGREVP